MAKIDVEKLAKRLGELNKNQGGGREGSGVRYADINDGRNQYRLLPGKDDPTEFYAEAWVHYGVGKGKENPKGTFVVCPTTKNEKAYCPQCELAKQLRKLSKRKDDTYDKQARQAMRKKRVYYNVLDRADDLSIYKKNEEGKWINTKTEEEESPVAVLAAGIKIHKDILGLICNPDYGPVMVDVDEGLDTVIEKSGSGQFGTEYKVSATRKETPAGFDAWEECLNDLSKLIEPKTADEIAEIMSGADPDDNKEDDEEEGEEESNPNSSDKEEPAEDEDDIQAEIKAAIERRRKQGK